MADTIKSSRGRPKPSPRERLLRAGELYYSEGIHAVGINRILQQAQTPIMSLYRNFGSKDGLVQEVFRKKSERLRSGFRQQVEARADNGRDRILATFDLLAEMFTDDDYRGCAFINITVEAKSAEDPLREIALQHKDWSRELFREYASDMGVANPDLLSHWLTLLMDGAFITAEMRRGDPTVGAETRALAEVLLDAIA